MLYQDTQLYRLGTNLDQIPINCPLYRNNFQQDGHMNVIHNQCKEYNYYENGKGAGPSACPMFKASQEKLEGKTGRYEMKYNADHFGQVRTLYKDVMDDTQRDHLITNITGSLGLCTQDIIDKMVALFNKVDPDYGARVQASIEKMKAELNTGPEPASGAKFDTKYFTNLDKTTNQMVV